MSNASVDDIFFIFVGNLIIEEKPSDYLLNINDDGYFLYIRRKEGYDDLPHVSEKFNNIIIKCLKACDCPKKMHDTIYTLLQNGYEQFVLLH